MINKYLFILLCCASALFAQNNSNHKLLWKVTSKNSKKSSYLFGTMHVNDKRVFRFSDSLLPSMARVEAFAGEMDMESLMPKMMDLIYMKKASGIHSEMSVADYELLDEKIQNTFGAPFDSINTQDTWIYELFLKRRGAGDGYHNDKETFLDSYLAGLAAQQKKKVMGLETLGEYSYWNNKLTDRQKAQVLLKLVKDKEEREEETEEDSLNAKDLLMELYSSGDVEKMHKIFMDSAKMGSQFVFSSLNYRNVNMVNRMDSIMKKQSLFAAVGALHLAGDSGMIQLLRAKGYTVEPVPASFNSKKKNPEIVKRDYEWADFTPPKSNFTVLMPMRPFKIPVPSVPGVDMQAFLSLDLSKMYNFMCMTLKMGTVISPEKEEAVMNAMLQNMLAKSRAQLVNKQFITNADLRRMEVILRKRRSYSKFTLFHRGGEILLLMMNGNKGQVYSNDANRFSNSVKPSGYEAPKAELKLYEDKANAFSLMMPSITTHTRRNIEGENGKVRMNMRYNSTPINGISYYLATYDYEDSLFINNAQRILDGMIESVAARLVGWQASSSDTTLYQCLAKNYMLENKTVGSKMKGTVLVRDNRVIMYWCAGSKSKVDSTEANDFISSLKLLPYPAFAYKNQFAKDSSYVIKLGKLVKRDTLDNNMGSYMPPHVSEYNMFYSDTVTTTRYSIGQYAYKKYYTPENPKVLLDTIWANIKDTTVLQDTIVVNKNASYLDILYNSETNGYVRSRYILGQQKLFIISAYAGKATLSSEQVTTTLNSFKPMERKAASLKDPKAQFYKDLVSSDSLTAENAFDALGYLTFKEKELPQLEKLLDRKYPLDSLHYFSTPEMIWKSIFKQDIPTKLAYAEKYYMTNAKAPKLQLSLLNGMTSNMDSLRFPLYKKLLVSAPPKLDSLPLLDIKGFSYALYAAKMFPEAYTLLDNPVWADFALDLTANAAADSNLSKESLKPHADKIINLIDKNVLGRQSLAKSNWNFTDFYIIKLLSYLDHARSVELLNKFMAKDDAYTKYLTVRPLLQLKQKLKPSDIQAISNDIYNRARFYGVLKEYRQEHLFPKKYVNQKSMAIADLATYISYDDNIDTTSITILKEKVIEHEGKKIRMYLMKYKLAESDIWYVAMSGSHPENKKLVDTDNLTVTMSYYQLEEMTEAKHFEHLISKFKGELEE